MRVSPANKTEPLAVRRTRTVQASNSHKPRTKQVGNCGSDHTIGCKRPKQLWHMRQQLHGPTQRQISRLHRWHMFHHCLQGGLWQLRWQSRHRLPDGPLHA